MEDDLLPLKATDSSRRTFLRGLSGAGIGAAAFAGEGLATDSADDDQPGPRAPPVRWKRTYGGGGEDWATDIAPTDDGGHVISGFGDGAKLVKLSGEGETAWNLDLPAFEGVTSVVQADDGGYVLTAGKTVVKLDPRYRREWTTSLGFSVSDLIQTADGGYAAVGEGIAALDTTGTVEWSFVGEELPPPEDLNELDPPPGMELSAIVQTDTGHFVAGGRRDYLDADTDARTELFLILVDHNRENLSLKRLFSSWGGLAFFGGIAPTPDGGFVLALEGGKGRDSIHLQKRCRTGELEFSREGRISTDDWGPSISGFISRDDEGYVLATAIPEELEVNSVYETGNVFGLDDNLNLRWGETYTRDDTEGVIRALARAGDGYAFTGHCAGDAWAVGLGADSLGDTTAPRNEIQINVRSPACEVLTVDHRCLYATPDCLPVRVSVEGPIAQHFILQEGGERPISVPPGTYTVQASVTDEDVRPVPTVHVTGSPVTVKECPGDDRFMQTARLVADERDAADFFGPQFGSDVAVDGDTTVIGAPHDDDVAEDAGAVYVFTRTDGSWDLETKLHADDGGYVFGSAVALNGDTALIGGNGTTLDTGAVYVFTRSDGSWIQQAKMLPDDSREYQYFGRRLAFEGNTALIGTFTGSAYVFTRSEGIWQQEAKLLPGECDQYRFGESVALSGDTALVGGEGVSVTVFTRSDGSWTQQAKLRPDGEWVGWSVAVDGDTALVGAARDDPTYVFTRSDGSWTQQARLRPDEDSMAGFGRSSLALQGDTALVSSPLDDEFGENAGAVYAFTRSDGSWNRPSKLTAYGGDEGDWFGDAVDLDADTALVGATYDDELGAQAGAAYVFTR